MKTCPCMRWHSTQGTWTKIVYYTYSKLSSIYVTMIYLPEFILNFWRSKIILYDTVMVNPCHYSFVKTHRNYNRDSETKVNYGL